jgi:hypothetical protein
MTAIFRKVNSGIACQECGQLLDEVSSDNDRLVYKHSKHGYLIKGGPCPNNDKLFAIRPVMIEGIEI